MTPRSPRASSKLDEVEARSDRPATMSVSTAVRERCPMVGGIASEVATSV